MFTRFMVILACLTLFKANVCESLPGDSYTYTFQAGSVTVGIDLTYVNETSRLYTVIPSIPSVNTILVYENYDGFISGYDIYAQCDVFLDIPNRTFTYVYPDWSVVIFDIYPVS